MQENSTKQQILELLREKTFGLTIEETSNNLKISRSTGSKYLAILEAEKRVVVRCIGKAKLYYLSEYYPPNGHFNANCAVLGNGSLMIFLVSMLLSFSVMGHATQNGFLLNTDQDAYGINRDIYVFVSGPSNADFTVKIFDPQGTLAGKKTDRTSPGGSAYLRFSGFSEAGNYRVKLEYGGETVNEKTFKVLSPGTDVCESCMPMTTTSMTTTNTALPATTTATTTITMIHTTTCTITKAISGAAELGGTDVSKGTTKPLGENETAEPGTLTDIVPPSPSPPGENVSDAENNITNESLSATETSISSTPPEGVSVVDINPFSAESVKGVTWEKIYIVNAAVNADQENEQTLTYQAKGRALYSCSDWDSLEKKCRIPWENEQDIITGEDYSLSPEEGPIVYAEAIVAYSLNIESDKEFEPDEDPVIGVRLLDEEDKAIDSQIEARLLSPEGERDITPEEIKKLPEGGYQVEINKRRGFAPGLNRIMIDTQYEGIPYTADYEFLWGVLAVNTDKSMYLPSETANISMAVLDDQGHMVCDADVTLSIRDPSNTETVLSTENGGIHVSDECGYYGVTTLPDYYAAYQVAGVGTYIMNLTAETADGTRSISESFTVESAVDYDVSRHGPTRIYPPVKYTMSFTIKPNKEYSGDIIETVPAGFEITPQEGLSVEEAGDEKRLIWTKSLERDETMTLSYEFDAPDISPYLYALGPLSIGDFQEKRQWMIASDAAGISGMAAYQLSAQATTPAWMNWTGSAWSAKNNANAVLGTVQWMVLRENPVRTEKILVTLDNQNDVIAQVWNGASWTSQTMTDNANLNTKKAFAANVMKSGKVMVAYNNNTAGMVAYRTWDGSSWSAQMNLTIGGSAQIEWIEIASSNQSDRLMLVVQTAATSTYPDIYAVPWDGTNWLTPVLLEDQSENTAWQNFDVAFEYSSDEVLVVWSDQALTTVQYNTYSFSSGWGTAGTGYNVATADIVSLRLAPYPGTNRIMMCCLEDSDADIDCQEWDGGAWQTGARPDGSVEIWTSSTRNFDVAPNVATGGFLFIYGDSNDDWYDFFQCTSQANCQAGTWVTYTTWSTTDIGTDTSWAQLYPAFNEPGRFTAIMLDQLTTTGWRRGRISCTASGCTSLEAPTAWGAVSSVAYESASFAYDIYEPPKPNNNTIWDETDPKQYGGATKYKNQPVMFYANYTNTTGYPINATLAPDAYCRITIYNVSYWTTPVNMEYNGTKKLYQYNMTGGFSYPGNYSWNVTCNATGFRGNFTTDNVYINNTAPETVVDGPVSTDWFARSNTAILLRCNASDYEDPITSLKVHFQWDASAGYSSPTIPMVNNSATQNPFIVTFNAQTDAECSAAGIGATGRCYFQCYANDSLNAIDATPAQNSFGIDGEAPTGYAAGMQGKSEGTWMNGTSFSIVCTGATDPNSGSGVSTYDYEYTATDDCSGDWSTVTGCTDIAGTCSWTSPPHDETGFCVRCRATDAVGNDGIWDDAQYSGIDNTAPSSCSMTRPLQYYNITSSSYTLASDESDAGSGMQNVTFQYYYDQQWKMACAGTSAAQSYNCSWTVPLEIENLRNVSIRAICFDVVNYSLASANVSNVTADAVNSNPGCAVSYPNGYENVSGTIVVNASASDIDPTDYVNNVSFNYSSDGVTWNYISTNATPGLTSYAVSWDTSGKNGNNYRIRCLAADSRGGYGQDESDNPFTVDNTPPTVSAESVNATSISISEYVCLNLTATDNFKVDRAWAEIDVPSPGLDASIELHDNGIGCDAAASDNVYSAQYQSTYDGTYTWTAAKANDTAGNLRTTTPGKSWTVSSTASMTANMESPAADIRINESNGGNSYVQGCNVTCDPGSAACNDVVLYAQYRPDTWVDITTSTTDLTNAENEHSCGSLTQGQTCKHDFTVTSGSHSGGSSWEIRCRAASTTASQSNSLTVNVTVNDMPHAAWFYPSYEGQWLSGIVNLNASSSSDADGTITRYVYHLDDNQDFSTPFLMCDTAGSNCTFDTTGQGECAQNDNINCFVRVNVTDNDGASNYSVRRIGIDNTGPVTTLDRPNNTENISANFYTANASVSDAGVGTISAVVFEYRQSPLSTWQTACTYAGGSAPYQCIWDLTALPDHATYEVRARANDTFGNLGSYSTHTGITVDRKEPGMILIIPEAANMTTQTTMRFNFTAIDNVATTLNCSLYLDSALNQTNSSTQNNTNTNFTVSGLTQGLHTWYINCSDYTGNSNVSATRNFTVDYTAPAWNSQNQTINGYQVRVVHRGETISLSSNWTDNVMLDSAFLSTNESWTWQNISGLYSSPQLITGTNNRSIFQWSNSTIAPGTNFSWRIYANDSTGNVNYTNIMNLTMWGWSKLNASILSPSTINMGNQSNISCQVVDNVTGLPIAGYPVYFYNSTSLLGINNTGADGWAKRNFSANQSGIETITCNITHNDTLYYNISLENQMQEYLTVQEVGAPIIYRIISDPCERGTYCRAGIVAYNPNPTTVTIKNVTDTWSTDRITSISQCCTPDGCNAVYCAETPAGTINFTRQSSEWSIQPNSYLLFWYEILNTNAASVNTLTARVSTVEWNPATNSRANVDIINTAACAWTSWSTNATDYDTASAPPAILQADAGSTIQYTVRLAEFCNVQSLESTSGTPNNLSITIPAGWTYVADSAYWEAGGGSCDYTIGNRLLSCSLPSDLRNGYFNLKLNLTAPSTINKYVFTTEVRGYDTQNVLHGDINDHLILTKDFSAPAYTMAGSSQDAYHRGEGMNLYAHWTDNYLLGYAVLSTNESGAWDNKSGVYGSPMSLYATEAWSNFTWQNGTLPLGTKIFWRIYANDTTGNTNSTPLRNFTVWGRANTSTNLSAASVLKNNPVNISCFVRDTYNLSGMNNYPVNVYSNGTLIASGSTSEGWLNTTYAPTTYGIVSITCNITDSAARFYNASLSSSASLQVNDSYKLNITVTNSSGSSFENTNLAVYDLEGNFLAAGTTSIKANLVMNGKYNLRMSVPVNSTDSLTAVIRGLNMTNNFTLRPQVTSNYTGFLVYNVSDVTALFALNDTSLYYEKAELYIPDKDLDIIYIAHCRNWSFTDANCSDWEFNATSDYNMQQNGTHIWFNVTDFSSFGGGQGTPLPNVTQIRVYDVTGLSDTHSGGALLGSGLNTTFYFRQRLTKKYRVEFSVRNDGTTQWSLAANDDIRHEGLNSAWNADNVNDVWYNIDGTNYTGGNWSQGKVVWNGSLGGKLAKNAVMTFNYVFNMTTSNTEKYPVYFLCNDTSTKSGSYDNDTYNITRVGALEVNLTLPPQIPGLGNATSNGGYKVGVNRTFIVNATVYCRDGFCDKVNGTLRYNYSSPDPDTGVNTTTGDKPFYILSGVNTKNCNIPMRQDDFCNITWFVNSTGGLHAIWKLDALFGSNLSEANDTGDISMEITKVVIISLGWDTTNFGAVDAMSSGNPAQENGPGYDIAIDPNSNDIDGLYVKGTDLAPASVSGFQDISYGIGVGNITWNHYNNYSDSTRLTTEYARMNESLPCSTTVKSYYWIDIPKGQYTQEYSGKLYIMANAST